MAIDERLMKHARGAMIGLAIGDALGMPTQSMSAERIIDCYGGPVRRLMDAVPQQPIAPNMKAGSVTDDTEQAFVLAARLIEDHGRIDNDAYAQDLLRWEAKMKEKGSLDLLGPSTKAALQALESIAGKRVLVVLNRDEEISWLSLRNVASVHLIAPDQLNAYDVVVADDVVFSTAALDAFVAGPAKGKSVKAVATESEAKEADK